MSGGVDSSVAALLLAREGRNAIGVSMQVWDYRNNGGCQSRATCCAPDDFTDARKVAAHIGIPYYVFDFEKKFRADVIDVFVESYFRGVTPNPCIDCNSKVKFQALRERGTSLGATSVATGHYARITEDADGFHLLRSTDRAKDQSYFLYNLKYDELRSTLFPVGGMTKDEVRGIAREAGLSTAAKPESQDICFVSGTVQDFIGKIGKRSSAHGEIVTRDGTIVGSHTGIHNYTVGQRRGLAIGGTEQPLYVLEIDTHGNRIIVGQRHELERSEFRVGDVNIINRTLHETIRNSSENYKQ